MAHGETSCGIHTIELPEICRYAKEQGALTIVDAVVTLAAMPVQMAPSFGSLFFGFRSTLHNGSHRC
jgi:aspartate aminotransferase-like enzyme